MTEFYKLVTILSENEWGQLGTETWDAGLTKEELGEKLISLQDRGWEPIEVQVDEDQHDVPFYHLIEGT